MTSRGYTYSLPARKMRKIDSAWLAGLFDGEGSIINVNKSSGGFCLRLQMAMCNEEIMRRVQEVTGCGALNSRIPNNPKHSEVWTWCCNGENARKILQQILPFLIVKRERAYEMLSQYTITLDPS